VTDYTGGTTHHFVAYDGNGNVAALVDGSSGAITAKYEYGPFGEPLRGTGTMAKRNPIRFSTKFTDNESGFLYYGYRFYKPSTGSWIGRDPIGEKGGANEFAFTGNRPPGAVDALGLASIFELKVLLPIYNITDLPDLGQTVVAARVKSYKSTGCGLNQFRVYDVRVGAVIQERFKMSIDEAQFYQVSPGFWDNIQAHEDSHVQNYAQYFAMMFLGYNLIYDHCVCRRCYDQWVEYIGMLDHYSTAMLNLANDDLDCTSYRDRASCDEAARIRSGLANLQDNMRIHGQLLVNACPGVVVYAKQ